MDTVDCFPIPTLSFLVHVAVSPYMTQGKVILFPLYPSDWEPYWSKPVRKILFPLSVISIRTDVWWNSSQWDLREGHFNAWSSKETRRDSLSFSGQSWNYCRCRHLAWESPRASGAEPWKATPGVYSICDNKFLCCKPVWVKCYLLLAVQSTSKWYTNLPTFQEKFKYPIFFGNSMF